MQNNKLTTYLLYAIGEIVLVVIGILIAVSLNNWNAEKKTREASIAAKQRLISSLKNDMKGIEQRLAFFKEVYGAGKAANRHLQTAPTAEVAMQWKFIEDVFKASQIWEFRPHTITYDEIQNAGLFPYMTTDEEFKLISKYYLESPLNLTTADGGTVAYRDLSRGLIPVALEEYLWNNCFYLEDIDRQKFVACPEPVEQTAVIQSTYRKFLDHPEFERILTRRLSTVFVQTSILNSMKTEGLRIIAQLEST